MMLGRFASFASFASFACTLVRARRCVVWVLCEDGQTFAI
jgi:hypothetical protein